MALAMSRRTTATLTFRAAAICRWVKPSASQSNEASRSAAACLRRARQSRRFWTPSAADDACSAAGGSAGAGSSATGPAIGGSETGKSGMNKSFGGWAVMGSNSRGRMAIKEQTTRYSCYQEEIVFIILLIHNDSGALMALAVGANFLPPNLLQPSWPGLTRPSTRTPGYQGQSPTERAQSPNKSGNCCGAAWMAGARPAMTGWDVIANNSERDMRQLRAEIRRFQSKTQADRSRPSYRSRRGRSPGSKA